MDHVFDANGRLVKLRRQRGEARIKRFNLTQRRLRPGQHRVGIAGLAVEEQGGCQLGGLQQPAVMRGAATFIQQLRRLSGLEIQRLQFLYLVAQHFESRATIGSHGFHFDAAFQQHRPGAVRRPYR